jgi:hypothetical protein
MLKDFIRQLSKDIGAESPLEASAPGVYEYLIADDLAIIITEVQPDGFMLSSVLGPFPKGQEDAFLLSMMEGNLFGKETIGATLGLDREGKLLTLSRIIERRVDYREFKETLEDFFHIVNFWRDQAEIKT